MCIAHDTDLVKHAADFALSRLAVLKAVGPPEFREILVREAELRRALGQIHVRASRQAVQAGQKATRAGKPLRAILAAVKRAYKAAFDDPAVKAITSQMSHFYALGKRAAWRRALGASKTPLEIDPPLPPESLPGVPTAKALPLEVAPTFDLQDVNAINRLNRHQVFWVGEHYDKNLSRRIAWTARDVIVRQGLTGENAAKGLGEALKRELDVVPEKYARPDAAGPVPPGWKGSAANYYDGLATNAATTARNVGSIDAFRRVGTQQFQVLNPLDERTCDRCGLMNGKIFPMSAGGEQADALLGASTPAGVRKAQPWLKVSKFKGLGVGRGAGTAGVGALMGAGQVMPPYHMHCRCTIEVMPGPPLYPNQPRVRTRPAPKPKIPKKQGAPVPATVPQAEVATTPPVPFKGRLTPNTVSAHAQAEADRVQAVLNAAGPTSQSQRRDLAAYVEKQLEGGGGIGIPADSLGKASAKYDTPLWRTMRNSEDYLARNPYLNTRNLKPTERREWLKHAKDMTTRLSRKWKNRTKSHPFRWKTDKAGRGGYEGAYNTDGYGGHVVLAEPKSWLRFREIVWHEHAHWIEHPKVAGERVMRANRALWEARKKRTGAKLRDLRDIEPGVGWPKGEKALDGAGWIENYAGRVSIRGEPTEVFAVGFQKFATDEAMLNFAKRDPEHFGHILSILRGDYL